MKKILTKIIGYAIALSFLMVSVCHAANGAIPDREIAIGGIQLGATSERIRSIYGEPSKIYSIENVRASRAYGKKIIDVIWEYGTTLTFKIFDNKVIEITTTGNNGIKVPAGFSVGDNLSDVINYYEQKYNPYPQSRGKSRNYANTGTRYQSDKSFAINFRFESDGKGKVKSISIGWTKDY